MEEARQAAATSEEPAADEASGGAGGPAASGRVPTDQAAADAGRARPGRRRRIGAIALKVLAAAAVIALIVWVNEIAVGSERIRAAVYEFGYGGLFVIAAFSGFNLVVPVPVVAFFPFFMEAGLQPVPTVATIALGMTTGDMVGYLLGYAGREVVHPPAGARRWLDRLERLRARHPHLPYVFLLFYAALVPLPNELIVVPMAFLGYRLPLMFVAAFGGNLVFNGIAASGAVSFFELW